MGYNGQEKVDEIAGAGNHTTAEFWEYDTRLGRRWNVDPVVKPWESSYACFANNPIWFSDVNGDVPGEKPNTIGTTKAHVLKISSADIKQTLEVKQMSSLTGLSIKYAVTLAQEEKLVLSMYDVDGKKGQGGNATIGFGHKVHTGAIGSGQYDKNAIAKEKEFRNGITVDKAFDLFVSDLKTRTKTVDNFLKLAGVSVDDEGVKSTLVDIYFNAGTADLKTAIGSYKQGGATGLLQTVNNGDISNPSEKRKQLRVVLLESAVKKETEAEKDK